MANARTEPMLPNVVKAKPATYWFLLFMSLWP
jgi:hypothetical protein